jgi:hypothetical protein
MPTVGPHLLGRRAPADTRHIELHPFTAAPPAKSVEVEIKRPTLNVYNQKQTPHCVSYSTSKVKNWFDGYAYDAEWLYARCKEVDGMPNEDGTNARAACDVLRTLGHLSTISGKDVKAGPQKSHGIASNTWATSVDDIRAVFARPKPQPVLIGIEWLEAWFHPAQAHGDWFLQPPATGGGIAGGHEIGIWACSDKRQAFGLSNTWGDDWTGNHNDLVYLPYATMAWLFGAQGDACVIKDLPTR